jgi:hypothetical protein
MWNLHGFPWYGFAVANGLCPKCGAPSRRGGRYCLKHHAENAKATRPRHSAQATAARVRANARSYANVYLRRGKIKRKPCQDCGNKLSEMQHLDYTKPLEIVWRCVDCRRDWQKAHPPPYLPPDDAAAFRCKSYPQRTVRGVSRETASE